LFALAAVEEMKSAYRAILYLFTIAPSLCC
jgi:hypothetical protein